MRFPKRKASGTDFLTPSYKKSIKEIFLLDKWGFEHKFGAVSVQSVQKITIIVILLTEKTFQTDKNDGKTIFKVAKQNYDANYYKIETKEMKTVIFAQKQQVSQIFVRDAQENFLKIVEAADRQNEKYFL